MEKQDFQKAISRYCYYPCSIDLLCDFDTPLSLFQKLQADFLLESVEKMSTVGRYSFIGIEKREQLSLKGDKVMYRCFHFEQESEEFFWKKKSGKDLPELGFLSSAKRSTDLRHQSPLELVREHYLSASVAPLQNKTLPFVGGLIGYMGFEAVRYFESLPEAKDVLHLPDVVMVFPRFLIVYDNSTRKISLIYLVASPFFSRSLFGQKKKTLSLDFSSSGEQKNKKATVEKLQRLLFEEAQRRYDFACQKIEGIRRKIEKSFHYSPHVSKQAITLAKNSYANKRSNFTRSDFMKVVQRCVDYIKRGDAFQIVPSQRFQFPLTIDPFEVYRSLRLHNPSPYLFYLNFDDFFLVGSSPEMMVKIDGDQLSLRPLAGTRPRGANVREDDRLKRELLASKKELAEHLMLVDLGRNDIGRIAKTGSVQVSEYMQVEKYSHVQHIVSLVQGKKREDADALDVIAATFPAGTLSGAPKLRSIEIIAELEKQQRGPYGGMIFYLSLDGQFNSCITIRTLLIKEGMGFLQAGAGVVYDSVAAEEYQETLNKAQAIFSAIEDAGLRMENIERMGGGVKK